MKIKMDKNDYVTSEFPLAAALLCMKIQLTGMRRSAEDPNRTEFLFAKDALIETLIAGYWASNLMVEPKSFWNQCRELKSRIKSGE